jgi:hypothetical protein
MKKIILGLLAIGTLTLAGTGDNIKTLKEVNYKVSWEKLYKTNPEIENAISKFYTLDNLNYNFKSEVEKMTPEEAQFYPRVMNELYKYFTYKIKTIYYLSPTVVKADVEIKYPDFSKLDKKEYIKKLDKILKEKTGKTYDEYIHMSVLTDKETTTKYNKVLSDCEFEVIKQMLPNLKQEEYYTETVTLKGTKINNNWQFEGVY